MENGRGQAVKTLINTCGKLVYVAGIIYAEVHGYSLLSAGIDPDMLLWAIIGIVALGITAVILPEGIHHVFHAPLQRMAAFGFYALDLVILFLNAVLDYNLRSGGTITSWLDVYMTYVVPSTPVIAALGWTTIFLLDPAARERMTVEALRASTREVLAMRIAEQAKAADVSEAVERAAQSMAREVIGQTLGVSVSQRPALPSGKPPETPAGQAVIEHAKRPIIVSPMRRVNGRVPANPTGGPTSTGPKP